MSLDKFVPLSPDPDINVGADMTLARFGHLNKLVDEINSGGGGGSAGIIVEGEGLNSSTRCGVDNQSFGDYGSAIGGFANITCNDFTANTWGRNNIAYGCYSSINGTSNIIVARNSHILSGTNNTIACDSPQGGFSTQSCYSGNYFYTDPMPVQGGLVCGWVTSGNFTSIYPTDSTFSITNSYAYGDTSSCSNYYSQTQMLNVSVICSAYDVSLNRTCLYFCYDPTLPSFISTQRPCYTNDGGCCVTYSSGYIQKTGAFSNCPTFSDAYHPNTIAGGAFNVINGFASGSTISGGYKNTISGGYASIIGGNYNYVENSRYALLGTGYGNIMVNANSSFIGAGSNNHICNATRSSISAGFLNCIGTNSGLSMIGGGMQNCINTNSKYSAILVGRENTITCDTIYSVTLAGRTNTITNSQYSAILGGRVNTIPNLNCTFIVGSNITADRSCATFVNNLSIVDLPTASAGLPSKSLWYDPTTCVVKFVP